MKHCILTLIFIGFLFGCSKDPVRNNNPFLPNYGFSASLDLNLPSYNALITNLGTISFTEPSGNYVIIMHVAGSDYRAWNGNCPNQSPSACSKLIIQGQGTNAKCGCDNYVYSLFTGVGNAQYSLVPYRVEVQGDIVRVYN